MRTLVLVLSFLFPTAAFSLSCMPYGPIHAFEDAAASKDDYVAVHGRLTFRTRDLPKVDWTRQQDVKPDNFLSGNIQGKSLTRSGFEHDFERQVKINVQCMGPWCASLTSGKDYLMFLRKRAGTYLLEVNACGGFAFQEPSKETLDQITSCMRGKRCDPGPRRR